MIDLLKEIIRESYIYIYFYKKSDMVKITIIKEQERKTIEAGKGNTLLQVIRENGEEIYAPCGGNGTCGKCRVTVKNEGVVTSCQYYIGKDIEIMLPEKREALILEKQHEYTRPVSFIPGKAVELASYPLGVAIDIGTTTLVFYLVNMITGAIIETRTALNPQAKYGSDVISRIQFVANSPEKLQLLQEEIVKVINHNLDFFASNVGVENDSIVKTMVTGNNVMLHLLLGKDPTPMAFVPFTPAFINEQVVTGEELSLATHHGAQIITLPSVSAYIGADIVAGLASLQPPDDIKKYLFMDIGTNGELALVTPEKIWCCATAAGPAFEGASISCGMGAVEGAINMYGNNKYKVIGNTRPSGICGSAIIDIVAELLKKEIINKEGVIENDFIIADQKNTASGETIKLIQQDIREVQLAKSAIVSGIKIMLKAAGLRIEDMDALFLAGGFGNYINTENAMVMGLLPLEMKNKIIPVGNTSGTGAVLALKSEIFRDDIKKLLKKTHYIELSDYDDFELEFAMNMNF